MFYFFCSYFFVHPIPLSFSHILHSALLSFLHNPIIHPPIPPFQILRILHPPIPPSPPLISLTHLHPLISAFTGRKVNLAISHVPPPYLRPVCSSLLYHFYPFHIFLEAGVGIKRFFSFIFPQRRVSVTRILLIHGALRVFGFFMFSLFFNFIGAESSVWLDGWSFYELSGSFFISSLLCFPSLFLLLKPRYKIDRIFCIPGGGGGSSYKLSMSFFIPSSFITFFSPSEAEEEQDRIFCMPGGSSSELSVSSFIQFLYHVFSLLPSGPEVKQGLNLLYAWWVLLRATGIFL